MHETPDDLKALQDLLDNSYGAAGDHLKSIHFGDNRLSAGETCAQLKNVCILDLATLTPSGAPIVAPVDGLFLKGKFWFSSSHSSLRFRNIRNDARISAAHTIGEKLSFLVHGVAREIDPKGDQFSFLRDFCLEVYGPTFEDWGNWGEAPFAYIEPSKMFATKLPSG
jgi:hypothetical protein